MLEHAAAFQIFAVKMPAHQEMGSSALLGAALMWVKAMHRRLRDCHDEEWSLRPLGIFLSVQLQNKQDWARLHSYEVHQMAELVDSHMRPGPWQKVGMIRKVPPAHPMSSCKLLEHETHW
jgi:hypothetical protein